MKKKEFQAFLANNPRVEAMLKDKHNEDYEAAYSTVKARVDKANSKIKVARHTWKDQQQWRQGSFFWPLAAFPLTGLLAFNNPFDQPFRFLFSLVAASAVSYGLHVYAKRKARGLQNQEGALAVQAELQREASKYVPGTKVKEPVVEDKIVVSETPRQERPSAGEAQQSETAPEQAKAPQKPKPETFAERMRREMREGAGTRPARRRKLTPPPTKK